MPERIDHVIIAGPQLEALEDIFARLDFVIVGGGAHPHLGTRNRVIILGEGYIELLAIADAARVSPALRQRIASGVAWVGHALQSDDIEAEARAMRARGVDARGPTAGRLVAPDGSARSWRVVTIGTDDLWEAALPLPFLIQHDSVGEAHRRELAGADRLTPHPNGARRLLGVTLTTPDLDALRDRYERAFSLTPASSPQPSPRSARFALAGGAEWIHLEQAGQATMLVRVSAPDLALVERMASAAGLACALADDALLVSLPDGAMLEFAVAP